MSQTTRSRRSGRLHGMTSIQPRDPSSIAVPASAPAPISLSPSQTWSGDDGSWSTFSIRIGTPPQVVQVLISTLGQETWAVLPDICNNASNPGGCRTATGESRGLLFNESQSTTWQQKDPAVYSLGLESNLGYTGSGLYGLDTVGFGVSNNSGPTFTNQVVAGFLTDDFYLGMLGIGPRPTNFTDFSHPQRSLLQTMKDENQIPSLSWSYTAGAPYRLKKVLGSLTFGGYDTSRFTPNSLSFLFAPDTDRNLVVGLQSISIGSAQKPVNVLPYGILAFVDSTVPHIWLPLEACKAIEQVLGITWDPEQELYLINDTVHNALLAMNPSFTFQLGNSISGGPNINITLPYASFNLDATPPFVSNATKYFPLKRAQNDTQITLGRTFLQEAYLTADFERNNFSISQCVFTEEPSSLVGIPSINSSVIHTYPRHNTSILPTGTKVAVSVVCFLVIVGVAAMLTAYRKRKWIFATKASPDLVEEKASKPTDSISRAASASTTAQGTQDSPIEDLVSPTSDCIELDAPPLCELPHNPRYELPGDDLNCYPELSEAQTQPPLRRKFSWEVED